MKGEVGAVKPIKALQKNIFTDLSKAVLLLWIINVFFVVVFSVLCLLCLCARLFICTLWSPPVEGLASWL